MSYSYKILVAYIVVSLGFYIGLQEGLSSSASSDAEDGDAVTDSNSEFEEAYEDVSDYEDASDIDASKAPSVLRAYQKIINEMDR